MSVLCLKVARLKKRGIAEPYIYIDIKRFLPHWAEVQLHEEAGSDDETEQGRGFAALASVLERGILGKEDKKKKRLDIVR